MVAFVFGLTYCATLNELTPNYGAVAERLNAPVLKTGRPPGLVGSNPTRSALVFEGRPPQTPPALWLIRNKPIALQWAKSYSRRSRPAR